MAVVNCVGSFVTTTLKDVTLTRDYSALPELQVTVTDVSAGQWIEVEGLLAAEGEINWKVDADGNVDTLASTTQVVDGDKMEVGRVLGLFQVPTSVEGVTNVTISVKGAFFENRSTSDEINLVAGSYLLATVRSADETYVYNSIPNTEGINVGSFITLFEAAVDATYDMHVAFVRDHGSSSLPYGEGWNVHAGTLADGNYYHQLPFTEKIGLGDWVPAAGRFTFTFNPAEASAVKLVFRSTTPANTRIYGLTCFARVISGNPKRNAVPRPSARQTVAQYLNQEASKLSSFSLSAMAVGPTTSSVQLGAPGFGLGHEILEAPIGKLDPPAWVLSGDVFAIIIDAPALGVGDGEDEMEEGAAY